MTLGKAYVQDKAFKARLITKGRKTGREHSVWLRAVSYDNKIYFSRRNPNSDWLKNALASPTVKVIIDERAYVGTASLVDEQSLVRKISKLKYPGEKRSADPRVVLEVRLEE